MYKLDVVVKSLTGLHARPGADVVEMALKYKSDVKLIFDGKEINAKEIFEVLSANVNCGDQLSVQAVGPDEIEAVKEIAQYIETKED